jgi:hypothetical protein
MYHWCLLIKKYSTNAQRDFRDKLIADHEPGSFSSIDRKANRKLFLLGLIEFTPTALGITATEYLGKILLPCDYIIIGVFISTLLVNYLSKKAPQLPFSIEQKAGN